MYTLRRGGFALIASGGLLLALLVASFFLSPKVSTPAIFIFATAVAYALVLAGLPAIYAMQPPKDRVAQIAFLCVAIGAAINVLALLLATFGLILPDVVFYAYLVLDLFGYLLLGWITARAGVFPNWVGWTLLAAGAVTLLLGPAYTEILLLFSLVGFGVTIVRATQSTIAIASDATVFDETPVER
jgi:hypothetical protein